MSAVLSLVPAPSPIRCEARRLLTEAEAALSYSQYIEAGCYLREAVRQILEALCQYHDVQVSRRKIRRTCGALIDALKRHEHLDDGGADYLFDALYVGNRAAHLEFVTRQELSEAICRVHWLAAELPIGQEGGDA